MQRNNFREAGPPYEVDEDRGMRPSSCPSEEELKAFQLGDLPEAALQDVAAHLETCLRCETLARLLDTAVDPVLAALRNPSSGVALEGHTRTMGPLGRAGQRAPVTPVPSAAPALHPAQLADEAGRLGNYRIRRLLGQGGMGFVFEAEDLTLGRTVALKVMKQELHPESEGWQRFLREARIMASIKHDNLITVYQAGQEGSVVYLAMELLQGESLEDRIQRAGPLELDELMRVARELTAGLAAIHRHGLVHRDLKPANIWLEEPEGRVKILDFGLARAVEDKTNLTQTGIVMGTPTFMSPEQAQGQKADARSDLFSLGCVLYCLATGVRPFDAQNTLAILSALALRQPQPVRALNPAVPEALSGLIMHLLAKDPGERPATADEVARRLKGVEQWLAAPAASPDTASLPVTPPNRPPRPAQAMRWAGRTGRVLLAVAGVAFVTVGAWTTIKALIRPHDGPMARSIRAEQEPVGRDVPVADQHPATAAEGQVYLSNLLPLDPVAWPFPNEIPDPNRENEPADWPPPQGGHRVRVKGEVSLHGIFMHLPPDRPQRASVSFFLGKRFSTFDASVSLNDGPPECDPMIFTVYGDGKVLWRSRPVSSQADTQSCKGLSIHNVEKLTLEVRGNGDERGTHAVWIEPSLTRTK
jgi:serine/threonine protein kinase